MSTMQQLALFDEPQPAFPERVGLARASRSESLSLLTPGKGRTSDFDYTLNPYIGCTFNCSYCFAQAFVADEWKRANWGQWVDAKVRALEVLRKKDLGGKHLFMSSVTDPYQPLERKIELTRSIVEELLRQQSRLVVQTRSPIAERDIDLFQQFKAIRINLSITTDDEEVRKRFEPGCPSVERRLTTLERMGAAGLKTCLCISPMLPMQNIEDFARRVADIGPTYVTTAFFLVSDRAFASDTRKLGLAIAEELGWTRDDYERSVDVLRKHLPQLTVRGEGFSPEGRYKPLPATAGVRELGQPQLPRTTTSATAHRAAAAT